jgi:vitamin B12 transporter
MKNASLRAMPRLMKACVHPRALALATAYLALGGGWAPAQAQTLPTVVVTPTRTAQPLADALPHTTVLGPEDIVRSQAVDLPSLLVREAGFQFNQNGGRGTASSLFLRGASSLQVLVLVDGVPITKQDATGTVSLEHLMLDQIERVEIVRGNVSAVYGSGAIGGVIQIFSKRAAGAPSAQLSAEAGSRGSYKLSASAQAALAEGATRISAGLSSNRTDGFSAIDTAQLPNANTDKDAYRNENWSLSLSQDLAKGHTVGLRSSQSLGRFGYDSGQSFDAPTDIHTGRTRVQSHTLFSENRFTPNWLSRLSFSQSEDDSHNDVQSAFPFNFDNRTRNRILNWTNTVAVGDVVLLTLGLEQQRQAYDNQDSFGGDLLFKRKTRAVFAGASGDWGAHSLQANVRSDKAQGFKGETTGYLGYGYKLGTAWKVLASTSSAVNIPPLGYLFDPFSGNPGLRPEKAQSRELGLQYSQGLHIVRATAFSTRTRDLLLYNFNTFGFDNIGASKNEGLELSYSGTLAQTSLRASLTAQTPKDETTGDTLRRRAKSLAAFSVSHPIGAWRLGADWRYSGGRPDGTDFLSAYSLLDLSARYAISKEWEAFARVENAGKQRYQTAFGYNQTPRGFFAGLRWTPKF